MKVKLNARDGMAKADVASAATGVCPGKCTVMTVAMVSVLWRWRFERFSKA